VGSSADGETLVKGSGWGAWVTQSVKQLTLDFCSGPDLRVRSSPAMGSGLSMEPV